MKLASAACRRSALVAAIIALSGGARAAAPNSFILNEANTVSGSQFLDKGRGDLAFGSANNPAGRVEGNGQNWIEFLVVQGDALPGGGLARTLDLRGWTFEWSYDKQDPVAPNQFGAGTIRFTNDPLWAAVPQGTLLTINEWRESWYLNDTPAGYDPWAAGGLQRAGGVNGVGDRRGTEYDATLHTKIDFSTDLSWNPLAPGGGDWDMHVWAGERNDDASFKYFEFTGSMTNGEDVHPVGTNDAGLYAVNNDSWQWTIKDAQGNVIQGPVGEEGTGLGTLWSVNPTEVIKLEAFDQVTNPTSATYLGVTKNEYRDGSSSTFGGVNSWSSGAGVQGLANLRNWAHAADATLDGVADGADFLAWQRGFGMTNPSLTHGDFTGDGVVDALDLQVWRNTFAAGNGNSIAAAVPEGSSMLLGLCGAVALPLVRRLSREYGSVRVRTSSSAMLVDVRDAQ